MARTLHWLMAVLILGQVWLGAYAHDLGRTPLKIELMTWHKSIGITVLLLAAARLAWALGNTRPQPPQGVSAWQRRAALASHATLYGLMLCIPLSGWLHNSAENLPFQLFRIVPWPALIDPDERLAQLFGGLHEGLVTALVIVLAVHVAAALWHHFVRRDDTLGRMLRDRSRP